MSLSDATGTRAAMGALSLKRNFSWTFAGNIASTASQFGMLLALARLGDAEMVGQYGLSLAVTAPIFVFVGMSLRDVQVTDVRDDYSFSDYALVRFISLTVGLVLVAMFVTLMGYAAETAAIILLTGLMKVIDGMSDIIFGMFQKHEQMDKIAKSMMIKAVVTLAAFAAVLWLTGNLLISVASISVVWIGRLLAYDVPNLIGMTSNDRRISQVLIDVRRASSKMLQERTRLLALVLFCLPVALSSSLISLTTNIPRYVIEWFGDTADLGVFTVLAYPLIAGNTIISALSQSCLPRLSRHRAEQETAQFTRILLRLLMLAVGLAMVSLLLAAGIGEEVLRLAFGEQYSGEEATFLVLVLGMGFGFINWFLNTALHAMRAFTTILLIHVAALALTVGAALLVIPAHGIYGGAWVVAGSMAIQVMMKAIIVNERLGPGSLLLSRLAKGKRS